MGASRDDGRMLILFSGLPGTGKSTLGAAVAQACGAVFLRVDTVEQGLRELCGIDVEGEGYRLAYRVASDNLRLGLPVVADSCNPIELTRREWERVATDAGARFVNVEVVCSDADEHRRRVETRTTDIPGLRLPTWRDVRNRDYDEWTTTRIVIDTAGRTAEESKTELLRALSGEGSALQPRVRASTIAPGGQTMSNELCWNLQMSVREGALDDARELMAEMVASTEQESGTRGYEWFLSADGKTCHLHERYVDSDAAMVHLGTFGSKFADRFLACFTPISLSVYGDPSPEARAALDGFGAVYLGWLGGFNR